MSDFDSVIERTGTDSMKWDVREGEISMGIADMDFQSAPCVREAVLRQRRSSAFMAMPMSRRHIMRAISAGGHAVMAGRRTHRG